jgi:hypothetical protein
MENNTIYRINIANLIDLLIEMDTEGVEYVNMRFYPEQNKIGIIRIEKDYELPEHFTIDDLIR